MRGTITIEVLKRVKANDEDEARELAKEMYEEENGGDWEEANKYEREDYVWAAYERLKGEK